MYFIPKNVTHVLIYAKRITVVMEKIIQCPEPTDISFVKTRTVNVNVTTNVIVNVRVPHPKPEQNLKKRKKP